MRKNVGTSAINKLKKLYYYYYTYIYAVNDTLQSSNIYVVKFAITLQIFHAPWERSTSSQFFLIKTLLLISKMDHSLRYKMFYA